jgi:outer membrane protein
MRGRIFGVAAFVATMLASSLAAAAAGQWVVRGRVLYIDPDVSSAALNLDVDTRFTPELDISRFITNNFALELILATQRHDVTAGGVNVGHVSHLPPTVTAQWHFMPEGSFRPYVGVGLNYTRFYNVDLGGGTLTVDKNSWGPALQIGADVPITKTLFLNFDVKKIWIKTNVKSVATGATLTDLKINPWIYGVGIGMRF